MMTTFRHKGTLEAIQWTGDNTDEVREFIGEDAFVSANDEFLTYKINWNPSFARIGDYFVEKSKDVYIVSAKFYVEERDEFERLWELESTGSKITFSGSDISIRVHGNTYSEECLKQIISEAVHGTPTSRRI
jgi:hypothetical protein